jgi:hypothetical protein
MQFKKHDWMIRMRMAVCMIFGVLLWPVCTPAAHGAQPDSLERKLARVTDFVPQAPAPVDQLVEVARRFKIPVAIEWVERPGLATGESKSLSGKRSVRELLQEITNLSPEHRIEVNGGLVHIYSPTVAVHPFNFLNLRLRDYSVKENDLFGAEDQLRWAIRFTLEPEKYLNGYAGGYGHGTNHVFEIPKFTFSGADLTVREVLDRIALAQANALWVATIKSSDLEGDVPRWKRKGTDGGVRSITAAWHFTPLAEITELAKERVAIDVTIDGMLDQRMTTVPVMLDEGLAADSGGEIGGSSSDGNRYQYAATIEKLDKDSVTVSIRLKVGRTGAADFSFEEKLQVYKGRIIEVRPESRIRIRGYFEGLYAPESESPGLWRKLSSTSK